MEAVKGKMNEDFGEYRDLIQRMEAAPPVSPPSGFTQRVMGRLPEQDAGLLFKLKRALAAQVGNGFTYGWAGKTGAVSKMDCAFYFFITGFFYLIIGIILTMGLQGIRSSIAAMDWIRLQPHLTLGIALWLLVLGILLLMEGKNTIKVIRLGTLFYIFLAIVNGGLMHLYFNIPYAGIFISGFIGTGVLMGVMLAIAVKKMELRPV
jgi:hypothetical protein